MTIHVVDEMQYKQLISFLNRAFTQPFPLILPKLYKDNPAVAKHHLWLERDGKRVGAIASIPLTWHLGERSVEIRGIGMVATKKSARGGGVMSEMLNAVLDECKSNNVEMAVLGGLRQRYENYGFYPAGCRNAFTVTERNLTKSGAKLGYTFKRDKTGKLNELLLRLHNGQAERFARQAADFNKVLRTWFYSYRIVYLEEKVVGYVVYCGGVIKEIVLEEDAQLLNVLFSYLKWRRKKSVTVVLRPSETAKLHMLNSIAEGVTVEKTEQIRVFNFRSVLYKTLAFSLKDRPLPDLSANVEITDVDSFTVSIKGGEVLITDMVGSADYVYTEKDAVLAFFGPVCDLPTPFRVPFAFSPIDMV